MNRNDFLKLIETSAPADRHVIGEVSELISVFPYFQSAYMLLLQGLQNNADVKFQNQLRSSAIYIADREVLYYNLKIRNVPDSESEIISHDDAAKTLMSDSQQTVIETGMNSQDLIKEIEKVSVEAADGELKKGHTILISSDESPDDTDASILLIDEETGTIEERIFYMDPGFTVSGKEDLLELDAAEERSPVPGQDDQHYEPAADNRKQIQAELIDRFIISNPRIEPVRNKTEKQDLDISKPFVEEGGGFVTETLARIYITQGYFSKAIDIYEKLCLKFPEKSSYFASQIEKVKELLKN